MKQVGNRRTEDELIKLTIDQQKSLYVLEEQKEFKGTEEQLEKMQAFERAYIDGKPLISDEEWDILKTKFNYKESLTSIAPSGRRWLKLLSPLPSIDKAGNIEELDRFLGKFNENEEFRVELKLDGLTANVRYLLNKETGMYEEKYITSRGNGRYGLEINEFALAGVEKNWPSEIPSDQVRNLFFKYNGTTELPEYFELRGEAVIPINDFTIRKYGKNSVWRSVAAGIFNRKVPANLNGLLMYLYGKDFVDFMGDQEQVEIKIISEARLIHSLMNDNVSYLRGDSLTLYNNGIAICKHKNGDEVCFDFNNDKEELHIVFYSCSINGENISTELIKEIKGIAYQDSVKFLDQSLIKNFDVSTLKHTSRTTKNRDLIKQAVFEFYGTDENGLRDIKKPRLRNLYQYAMDGVIIKPVNSNGNTQKMDLRNHKNNPNKILIPKYPEDQIACKLLSEVVEVKLERIEYAETTLGNVTCTGILDKTYLTESGAKVDRINLHNPEWLQNNSWIKEGESYLMIMSMDVIPVLLNANL